MASKKKNFWGSAAKHLFLAIFTLAVIFPVLKVFQIALGGKQNFDMRINPLPDRVDLKNFWEVVTRSKVEGLGPQLNSDEAAQLARLLSRLPAPTAGDDEDEEEVEYDPRLIETMQKKGCFSCHQLGEEGREGLGGDLAAVAGRGEDKLLAWLKNPSAENARRLGLREKPLGSMERRTVWVFGYQLRNSLLVAAATTLLGIFLACTAAYAFSRFRFPGRKTGLLSFLVIQMFPGTMMMIPLYILMDRLGLLDQLLGLVLVYSTTAIPFCVWMLKGYFDTIPKELEEAAIIDGASRTRVFWTIILPLARPAIAVTGLFSFMTAWNEFILAATFMNQETSTTLPVMLNSYVSKTTVEWGHFAAGAILVSLPVVILFFILQKHLVSGLTAGGVKG